VADLEQIPLQWRKSKASGGTNCVEVAWPVDGQVFIRDSKDPYGPVLQSSLLRWTEFLSCLRCGRYDSSL